MDLLHLVDRLEELVASAQKMPIGSRAMVDRRRLLDIVDQMRVAIPKEVREAQELVARRDEARLEAEEEARLVLARAEERAARMVEQHELTSAAHRRAEEIAHQAELRAEERMQQATADIEQRIAESRRLAEQQMVAADDYARELLRRLDRQLQAFVRSVQSGIAQMEEPAGESVPPVEAARMQAGRAGADDAGAQAAESASGDAERPGSWMRAEPPREPAGEHVASADEPSRDMTPRDEAARAPVREPVSESPPALASRPMSPWGPPGQVSGAPSSPASSSAPWSPRPSAAPTSVANEPERHADREAYSARPAPVVGSTEARPAYAAPTRAEEPYRPEPQREPAGPEPTPMETRPEDDDGLENLLQRRARPAPPQQRSDPDVIDDFAIPPLDDQPGRAGAESDERPPERGRFPGFR